MRYEDVSKDVLDITDAVQKQYFSYLANARIKYLFDNKKVTNGGKLVAAWIKKANDVLKFITGGELEGFNYVVRIDKLMWDAIEEKDKIRIIRHELRHAFYDSESDDPYKLVGHDIEDFYAEVELAEKEGDLRWRERISEILHSVWDKE